MAHLIMTKIVSHLAILNKETLVIYLHNQNFDGRLSGTQQAAYRDGRGKGDF
jgi:hypothetical protein